MNLLWSLLFLLTTPSPTSFVQTISTLSLLSSGPNHLLISDPVRPGHSQWIFQVNWQYVLCVIQKKMRSLKIDVDVWSRSRAGLQSSEGSFVWFLSTNIRVVWWPGTWSSLEYTMDMRHKYLLPKPLLLQNDWSNPAVSAPPQLSSPPSSCPANDIANETSGGSESLRPTLGQCELSWLSHMSK